MNFWSKLPKPILCLAPMADVTDPAFRRIIAKYGKPDVMWTEFVSADGLFLGGYDALVKDLAFTEAERPIVAQFFTSSPERMEKAAAFARELGFDGIDINMGCPDKSIERQGAGACMIKNKTLAQEVVLAAKQGAGDVPVSVKTRLGYNKDELETWLPALLETKPAVVTVHARTRKEMSLVPARWERVKAAVALRDELKSETLIFGNGDVKNTQHARVLAEETGADGIMIGRAIFGNPWLFSEDAYFSPFYEAGEKFGTLTPEQIKNRLEVLKEHALLFTELLPHKNFAIMKKHVKAYISGWEGAKELRAELMETSSAEEMGKVIDIHISR